MRRLRDHWLVENIRDVISGQARRQSLWGIVCFVIGHRDEDLGVVVQCRRCYLNAPIGDAPRGWVP
jgi:hypothetical protein